MILKAPGLFDPTLDHHFACNRNDNNVTGPGWQIQAGMILLMGKIDDDPSAAGQLGV